MKDTNINPKTRLIAITGAMAAITILFTAYLFHIPVGANGGYIHFGDSIIYLAAVLLPTPYAMAVGALGGGIADLLTAPMWTIATVIIKILLVLPFSSKNAKLLTKRNLFAPVIAFLITGVGYYIAEAILFGTQAALIASISGSIIQALGSALFFYIAAFALENAKIKKLIYLT